ncbi:ribonuclease H-like [Rhinoderma darwinii]|uniref:ribonuclease H-like n=1 Tax=Rhinoderma darwinii TaxID=43563 RepID=UPI003F665CBC
MIVNADLTLFTDGSRYADEWGSFHTGYAVVSPTKVITAGSLPPHISAQEAELIALAEACRHVEGRTVNIYTDSRYAFRVAHDFGQIWAMCGYKTATGSPIKNAEAVENLLEALQLPLQVAVIKVKAHGKTHTAEAQGNQFADQEAKQAAIGPREEAGVSLDLLVPVKENPLSSSEGKS